MNVLDKPYSHKLDSTGITWIQECLKGGRQLSEAVSSKVNLEQGTAVLLITTPEHDDAARHNQPLSTGVARVRAPFQTNSQSAMLLHALRQLEEKYGPVAIIVEDDLTTADPATEKVVAGQVHKINDQYLAAQSVSTIKTATDLEAHLDQSTGYPLNAFVVPQKIIPDSKELNESDIDYVASSILAIINSAYDGETYALWLRGSE